MLSIDKPSRFDLRILQVGLPTFWVGMFSLLIPDLSLSFFFRTIILFVRIAPSRKSLGGKYLQIKVLYASQITCKMYAGHTVHGSDCTRVTLYAGETVRGHTVRGSHCTRVTLYACHTVRGSHFTRVTLYAGSHSTRVRLNAHCYFAVT